MLQALHRTLWVATTVAYPLVVYLGLQRWSAKTLSLALLALVTLGLLLGRLQPGGTDDRRRAPRLPLFAGGLLIAGAALGQASFVKAVPIVVSGGLLALFGLSLRSKQSLVETFARRVEGDLSAEKVVYCRRVTIVWCWFFGLNIVVTAGLAVAAPTAWWSLYTGIIAYVLIGALFTVEYVVRKFRFRDYGPGLHDTLLARLIPPRDDERPH